jgi:hypothetical protein
LLQTGKKLNRTGGGRSERRGLREGLCVCVVGEEQESSVYVCLCVCVPVCVSGRVSVPASLQYSGFAAKTVGFAHTKVRLTS